MRLRVQSLALLSGLNDPESPQSEDRSRGAPDLVWLWHRLAAVAPIRPQDREPPYAMSVALKKKKSYLHFFFFLRLFRAKPAPYGPQARGQIGAVAAAHTTAHGNAVILNTLNKARDRACVLMGASQIC